MRASGADARRAAARRGPGRRRLRRRAGRARRAARRGIPLVLSEADSHLGLANRLLARRARRVCLAFPIEGRDGRALPRDRPAGAAAGATDVAAARERFGIGAERARRARLRRLARRADDQRGGDRGVRRATDPGYRVLHCAGERDLPALRGARQRRALRPARLRRGLRAGARRRGPRRRARRAARCSRSPPPAGRRSSFPTRTRRATTRRATRAGWSAPAPRSSSPDARADRRSGCAREVDALLADRERLAAMAPRLGGARPAGRGRGSPTRSSRPARRRGRVSSDARGRAGTLHLVGIGGAGMSGYATVAAQLGAAVSGSDRADSPALERLRARRDRRPRRARRREPPRRAGHARRALDGDRRRQPRARSRPPSAACASCRAPSCCASSAR